MRHKKKLLTPALIAILLALLGTGLYLSLPVLKSTELYKNYDNSREITFVSERAKFSFKHPNWWPVSVINFNRDGGKFYEYLIEGGVVEYVDFEEEFSNQAGGPSLGFIIVEKTNNKDLKEYVAEISKPTSVYFTGKGVDVTIPPPKVEYLKIAGVDAISVTEADGLPRFNKEVTDYRLIRNGLLYRFATTDSSRFLENKERNSKTFKDIISSVKFF